ncbi:hypothetical protein K503DRAFT_775241 [Rhizopogon vinicolor AM-OR11-026]|uniref:Uncharacterized protein n=1 Tax=Rhizopogon vinicolor AM-OR11-026 TaxID=1314800 RepID=A0A1B7MME6_9AGAM|nr:hypothetical protein K503DRAFT_775241 [Rhizopogon vinicolor AM-OR11-026]
MIFVLQPGTLPTVLAVPSRICFSNLASRVILHIREVDKGGTNDAFTATAAESVMFADIVGQIEMEDQLTRTVTAQDQALPL